MMGRLEDALRDALAEQVTTPPAVDDAATRAMVRARRIRRRQAGIAAVAVVASLALLGTAIAAMSGSPSDNGVAVAPPASPVGIWPGPLAADVLVGNQIVLAAGAVLPMTDLPPARRAWRVTGGWLVTTDGQQPSTSAVYFVGQSGVKTKLAEGEGVAVGRYNSSGGPMVAWGSGGLVSVASFVAGGLTNQISTSGTGAMLPREIVGNGVLLADPAETYEMWFPSRGHYVPGPRSNERIMAISGDGTALLALVSHSNTCIAVIAPADMTVIHSRCDLDLGLGDTISTSPDGRWLVALSHNGVDLYDFTSLWRTPKLVGNWDVYATSVTWQPDGTFAVINGSLVMRLRTQVPGLGEVCEVNVPDGRSMTGIADLRE